MTVGMGQRAREAQRHGNRKDEERERRARGRRWRHGVERGGRDGGGAGKRERGKMKITGTWKD